MPICEISGEQFQSSEREQKLREKLEAPSPTKKAKYRFRELSAFWPHFSIHTRKSDYSGKKIVSIFDENCPYPVWHRDEWNEHNNPPSADFNPDEPFFEQLWELFQKCPIPHNNGMKNENCEFTDDFWHSQNCYLCHSGHGNQDLQHSFRLLSCKDCNFCAFSFKSEVCSDLINSSDCYNVHYAINSRNCNDSAFLFDCRNCSDCLFCWNLRNKKYCIGNKQLTKEEFFKEKEKFSLSSRKNYEIIKEKFVDTIKTKAWWKGTQIEKSENSTGDYLINCKNVENCFFVSENEDCVNCMRSGVYTKDCLDCVNVAINAELCHTTCGALNRVYDIKYCQNVGESKFLEYCAFCERCEHCFGCCGLVGKKYHIFNKEYKPEEYKKLVTEIKAKIKKDGDNGKFFPQHFSACSYNDSLANINFPLSLEEQKELGFRISKTSKKINDNYTSINEIPDNSNNATEEVCQKNFWDEKAQRPFQISKFDLEFSQKNNLPLPNRFYVNQLKENFEWMFFDGELRKTTCAKSGTKIQTTLPEFLNDRILCEKCYLKVI